MGPHNFYPGLHDFNPGARFSLYGSDCKPFTDMYTSYKKHGFMVEKLGAQRFNKLVLDHATEWWFQKTSLLIWLTTWRHQNGRKVNTELRRFFGASLISATTRMKFLVDICKSYPVSHQWRHKGNHILLMSTTTAFLEKLQHQHEENCAIRKPWWSS